MLTYRCESASEFERIKRLSDYHRVPVDLPSKEWPGGGEAQQPPP